MHELILFSNLVCLFVCFHEGKYVFLERKFSYQYDLLCDTL